MTPKEKAEELFNKFAKTIPPSSYVAYEDGVQINFDLENAKECALIAVNEILEVMGSAGVYNYAYHGVEIYWQEVKQEIEKL